MSSAVEKYGGGEARPHRWSSSSPCRRKPVVGAPSLQWLDRRTSLPHVTDRDGGDFRFRSAMMTSLSAIATDGRLTGDDTSSSVDCRLCSCTKPSAYLSAGSVELIYNTICNECKHGAQNGDIIKTKKNYHVTHIERRCSDKERSHLIRSCVSFR